MPTRPSTDAPSLRRSWIGTAVMLVAVIVGVGAVSLGSSEYQRVSSDHTTVDLQRQTGAIHDLERSLLPLNQRVIAALYLPTPQERAAGLGDYTVARDRLAEAFETAERDLTGTAMMLRLLEARDHLSALDSGVEGAEDLWTDGTVGRVLTAGGDPFALQVWAEVSALVSALTELGSESVEALQGQVADVNHTRQLIGPAVVGTVAVALSLGWLLSRRMSVSDAIAFVPAGTMAPCTLPS